MKITANLKQPKQITLNQDRCFSSENATWENVEQYLAADDRLLIAFGSQEQHGKHLPLHVDWVIPFELSKFISSETGVFCGSPVCYGFSWMHSGFPGTITVEPETLISLYFDVLKNHHKSGFKKIVILNGHGGNSGIINCALSKLLSVHGDLKIKVFNWWQMPVVQQYCLFHFQQCDSHAGPAETSVMLFLSGNVRMDAAKSNESGRIAWHPGPEKMREHYPEGVMQNDPRKATPEHGRAILELLVAEITEELNSNWE